MIIPFYLLKKLLQQKKIRNLPLNLPGDFLRGFLNLTGDFLPLGGGDGDLKKTFTEIPCKNV